MRSRRRAKRGFTLVEALVAMTLTTIIVGLVSSVFLAQNNYYHDVVQRSGTHDEVRSVVELASSDIRNASPRGIVLADSLRFVFRAPLSIGMVCRIGASDADLFLPAGPAGLDTGSVSGYGVRGPSGIWDYYAEDWSDLLVASGRSVADECALAGMDTVGVPESHYLRLSDGGTSPSPEPGVGSAVMLYQALELRIAESQLDPGSLALYRGTEGDILLEFASGLGARSHFEYRLRGQNTYASAVSGAGLAYINSVRIVAHGVDDENRTDPYEYEITQDVPLANAR